MKRLSIIGILSCLCCMAWAQTEKSDVSVLYVGGSSDLETVVTKVDSAVLAEDVKARMASFEQMLKEYFKDVAVMDAKDYVANLSDNYDVTIFDGVPPVLEPRKVERGEDGRILSQTPARYLPDNFSRPAVMIAEMGETLGRRIGLKTDWYCLCLRADAHSFRAEHPIFHGPFPVTMTTRMEPTPEDALHYAYFSDDPLPDSVLMWKVQTYGDKPETPARRIGMVSRPWGFEDSPEAEYISSGVCAKTIDAVAIGRHGNFLHWGFSASPRYMTDEAKSVFANAIVYISQFAGQTPIARKYNDLITTRGGMKEDRYLATRKAWEDRVESDKQFADYMLAEKKKAEEKQAAGESLTREEQMSLRYQPQPSMSYEDMLKRYQKDLFDRFGTDEQAYLNYYDENRNWFYGTEDSYDPSLDEDAKSWGIPNNDLRLLDRAIREWEQGGDVEKARRVLERYTLCRFEAPEEWRAWYEVNKNRLFFTEAGGWLFLVNTRDKSIPGNDYSVRRGQTSVPAATGLVTDDKNPVRAALTVEDAGNGNRVAVLRVKIHPGYHIYATVGGAAPFLPTEVEFALPAGWEIAGDLQLPSFKGYNSTTTIYEGDLVFRQEIKGQGTGTVRCTLSYQCCDAHICFPPAETEFTAEIK